MKRLRAVLFWVHLATGITIGTVVLTMAATGVLLTYQRQIQRWADARGLHSAASAAAIPLAPDELLARVREQHQGTITGVRWQRDAAAPVEVQLGREALLLVDAHTGAVLGDGSERARAFFRTVTDVHRWLALGDYRTIGRAITGAANLAFLFMVVSGFILWWPRNPTARAFRSVLLFRRGLPPKARDFNWHNVIGFWSCVPLIIIISSAVVISYGWAGALVERLAAERGAADAPRAAARAVATDTPSRAPVAVPGTRAAASAPPDPVSYADLLARAASHVPGWRSITMHVPARSGAVTFVIDRGSGGQPQRIGRLMLAEHTGEVVQWAPFSSGARPARLRSILRYAHTGEAAGVAGQTLAGLVSAGVTLLVWTGSALALRRLASWRRTRRKVA